MSASRLVLLLGALFAILSIAATRPLYGQNSSFDGNYVVTWGADHVRHLDDGRIVQLSMDRSSGSGFCSRLRYDSGFFRLALKTPKRDTAGVVTAFYLSSPTSNHDELDFEFLGNREGKPATLQTNIFTKGQGNREQRMHLWFDPSEGFHEYKVLWNPYHIVFFVDDVPVRVFKNLTRRGVGYPSQPMQIYASLWNGEEWATNGGKDKVNWMDAPFVSQFQGFGVDGCGSHEGSRSACSSSEFWWNEGLYRELTAEQASAYQKAKKRLTYDYCSDVRRFPVTPPECGHQ